MTETTSVRKESLPRPRVRLWWFILASGAVLVALPMYAISNLLHLSPGARIVRPVDLEVLAPRAEWHRQVEVNVGSFGLGLARIVAAFADLDDMDDVAIATLGGLREVQVSVFQARQSSSGRRGASFLAAADLIDGTSWQRVVGVLDGNDAVAVFVPNESDASGAIDICVAVCSDDTLVVVATAANLDVLAPLLSRVIARHHGDWQRDHRRFTENE